MNNKNIEFKKDQLVRFVDDDYEVRVGVIQDIEKNVFKIKLDKSNEIIEYDYDHHDSRIELVQSDLETEFEKIYNETENEIKEQLKIASEALGKAVKISDEKGVPFDSYIYWVSNKYVPSSFNNIKEKLGDLFLIDLMVDDIEEELPDGFGWAQSDFCY